MKTPAPHALGPRQSLSDKLPPGHPPHGTCSWGLPYGPPHCPLPASITPVRGAGSAESPVLSLPLSGLPPAQPGPCRTCWCLWRSPPTSLQHHLLTHSLPSPTSVHTAPVWVLHIALRTSYECLGLSLSPCPLSLRGSVVKPQTHPPRLPRQPAGRWGQKSSRGPASGSPAPQGDPLPCPGHKARLPVVTAGRPWVSPVTLAAHLAYGPAPAACPGLCSHLLVLFPSTHTRFFSAPNQTHKNTAKPEGSSESTFTPNALQLTAIELRPSPLPRPQPPPRWCPQIGGITSGTSLLPALLT